MEHMEHVNVHNACDMNVRHVTFVFTSFPNCYTEATALTRGSAVVIFFTCSNAWFCLLLIRSYQVSFRNKAYYAYHDWYHDWNSGIDWKKFSFSRDLILEPGIERPCSQAFLRFDHLANFFPADQKPICREFIRTNVWCTMQQRGTRANGKWTANIRQ